MKLTNLILFWMVLAVTASPAMAAGQYPISAGQVAAEINRTGMPVTPAQVTLLVDVAATTPNPVLKVRSILPQDGGQAIVRLECEATGQCLPFFVRVETKPGSGVPSSASNLAPAHAVRPLPNPSAQAPVLKRGVVATLLLEGDHIHISIPVISLQDGVPGQRIRVTSADHRETYMAQVVDSTLLRGRL